MKATLTFNLNKLEDKMAHFRCIKSMDMALFLFDILCIRKKLEYDESITEEQWIGIERVLTILMEKLDEYTLNVDELTN